jgi:hypothetical protein
MPFQRGHKKQGGRRAGAPNKLTGAAREVAHGLLADPEYQQSLVKRLRRGAAPRLELHLWELAFGRPRVEPEEAPEGGGASADLGQILAKLGEPKRQELSPRRPASRDAEPRDTPEELT